MSTETPTTTAATTTEGQVATQATDSATGAGEGSQQQQSQAQGQGAQEGQQATTETQAAPPAGAPEKYEFAVPEGKQYDERVLSEFSEAAREADLPQDKAQKFLDRLAPAMEARQQERMNEVRNEWVEAVKSDKEFGGDKLEENLSLARKFRDQFGTPELTKLLDETGIGDNPEFVRLFVRAGKAISEDRFVGGKQGQQVGQSVAQRMYPNMNP